MSVSPTELERRLVEQYKPLLVLYPEISSPTYGHRDGWREADRAPLLEDYHPREVGLVFDHARVRGRRSRSAPMHDRRNVLEAMAANYCDRIDILAGTSHTRREDFWAEYYRIVASRAPHDGDGAYPLRAYARVVYGQDADAQYEPLVALQYWMFYLYNDWKSTHEGDWEQVTVFLRQPADGGAAPAPIACAYSAHHGGYRMAWDSVERADDAGARSDAGSHPMVYVANGSHAGYFHGPASYPATTKAFGVRVTAGEFPFTGAFVDYTTSTDEGEAVFPDVHVIPPAEDGRWGGEWRWLNFTGEWGSSTAPRWLLAVLRVVPKRYRFELLRRGWGAPASLPPRRTWRDPFSWADNECEEAPVPGSWLVARR